jgi:hypothetical protein
MQTETQTSNPNEGKSKLATLIHESFESKSRKAHGDLKRKHVKIEVLNLFNIPKRMDLQ